MFPQGGRAARGRREMSEIDGPDFICVGMPKTGTGWLYDQLQCHPDFWMPPVKEILYLHRERPRIPLEGGRGGFALKKAGRRRETDPKPHEMPRDEALDRAFIEAAKAASGQPMDLSRYIALFRFKGARLSGDISPIYTELDPAVIAQLKERLPRTKLLMIARDPVARAWSRISMAHRGGEFDERTLSDAGALRTYLERSVRVQGKSFPTQIVAHWRTHAPEMAFRTFLFDDISAEPEKTRREIWSYLGADPDKPAALPADYNRKSKAKKLEMTEVARAVLVDFFADELKACAAQFAGRARDWPVKYGI